MKKTILLSIVIIGVLAVLAEAYFIFNNKTQTSDQSVEQSQSKNIPKPESEASYIEIKSGSYYYSPESITASAGEINLKVVDNKGFHTFVIDELEVKSNMTIGKTISFSAPPGEYIYYCDVPGHRDHGQEGVLIVK